MPLCLGVSPLGSAFATIEIDSEVHVDTEFDHARVQHLNGEVIDRP